MVAIRRYVRVVPVKRIWHLYFNLLEFRIFSDSQEGVAFPFGKPRLLYQLLIIPYALIAEIIFLEAKRYFIKAGRGVVGLAVFHEKQDSLFISSLGVAKEYRRLGIATYILECAETMAGRLGKKWLELSVLKRNTPAQRLYIKRGFSVSKKRKWSISMRKRI